MSMGQHGVIELPGFIIIEELYRTSQSVLFRALRESDTTQVVLKTVPARLASPETTAHLRREFVVARDLQDCPFIAKPLELVQHGDATALVLEDFGATSLQAYVVETKLALPDVLRVGIAVASALEHVHAGGLLHLDVKPANVLVSANLAVIKLTDFSISSLLPEHNQGPVSPESLRGTAAYISPEQTGRMNRTIDSRSDLYALGVTLYELATSTRPFHAENLQHLLYQHLALVPTSPAERDPAIPNVVSDIIMKCLCKDAANRYQTAAGLRADLQMCLDQLVQEGQIASFPLGRTDQRGQLRAPEHVMGREPEVQLLFHCLKRVVERGSMEVIFISGYSGIGKTSLVGELQRGHATGKEAFVQGKFDQYSHDTPFKPLIAAMQSLFRQVLCEPAATISVWKEKLQTALGRNGRLMTDVLPGLSHLLGSQPDLPPVDATAAQNRFSDTFVRLIRCCAQLRRPLVLFLDDLQWSDGPSLRLLAALAKDGQGLPLLLIGAYRDVEVDESHALTRLMSSLAGGDVPLLQLHLGPLKLSDTRALVAACLGVADAEGTEALAELGALVQEKTEGNPFYCLQFLRALVKDGLLRFDRDTNEYEWGDMGRLREKAHVTMNVVEFMANELRTRLPPETLEVLSMAACIGDVFSLRELTLVCEKVSSDLVGQLWPALTAGFIFLVGEEWQDDMAEDAAALSSVRFQFRHDRIRQAAYQEVAPSARPPLHLHVGRQLMAGLSPAQYEEAQYSILHHFNEAINLVDDPHERLKLANANMAAGAKAKGSTAYEVAVRHSCCARTLLGGAGAWEEHPQLMLRIEMEEAECLSLVGKHEEALRLLSELEKRVHNDASNTLRIVEMRVSVLTLAGQLVKSMDAALSAVALLGCPFPTEEAALEVALAAEAPRVDVLLAATDLEAMPNADDPKALALLRLMDMVIVGGYSTGQVKLIHLLTLRMVTVVLDAGHSTPGCVALQLYSTFFGARLKRYEEGYTLGKAALAILDRFADQSKRGQLVMMFASSVAHWVRPIEECISLFEAGLVASLDHGDHVYGAYNISQTLLYTFFSGAHLQEVKDKAESSQRALNRIGDTGHRAVTAVVHHATRVLLRDVPTWERSETDGVLPWDEAAYLTEHAANVLARGFYYTVKIGTLTYLTEYWEADAAFTAMGALRGVLQPTICSILLSFYEAIVCAQLLQAESGKGQAALESRLSQCVATLEEAADTNPSHAHRYLLARAEQERCLGDRGAAENSYALAIDAAEENRVVHDAALAYFLAGRHWSAVGRTRLGAWHQTEAYDAFATWGAVSVLHRLGVAPPSLRPGRRRVSDGSVLTSTRSLDPALIGATLDTLKLSSFSEQSMDIRAVLAASQTLSSAIVREALLEKLLGIVLETAGARYVALVLRRPGDDGGLYMEGSASVQVRAPTSAMDPYPPTPHLNGFVLDTDDTDFAPVDTVTRVAPAGQVVPLSEAGAVVPRALVTYVTRTQEVVLGGVELGDAYTDPYLERKQPRSVLCMPIVRHGESCGVLYVEHELLPDAFPASRIKILAMLSSQIAISIENSALYEQMQSRQNELIAAKNAAEEATRAKSLFLATMSHEIRTPLNAIIGMTSLMMGLELSAEKRECVETIRQSGDQLLAVISDVLDFSKIEAGTLELEAAPFNVRQRLEEAADLVAARAADKGLQLATHTAAAIPETLIGDVSRLRQVLVNLLSNAVKFTAEGEVVLRATVEHRQGKNVHVEFTCRDTGIGIAPDHIPRLFAAFSQADASTTRKFGGTGLGLAISDRLVKAMGGQFKVDSALGVGTTFRFSVKLEAAQGAAGQAVVGATGRELAGRRCLLIVNNDNVRDILEEQLTAWAMRCTHAQTLDQAQQRLMQQVCVWRISVLTHPSWSTLVDGCTFTVGRAFQYFAISPQGEPVFDVVVADKCAVFDQAALDFTGCPVAKMAPQLPAVVLCSWTDWDTKTSLGPLRAVVSKPVKVGHLWDALIKLLPPSHLLASPHATTRVAPINEPAGVAQPAVADSAARAALRILLTEDNPVNQRVAQMLLKRLGYRADCVADGIECIRSLESRPYDVVLMDLSMPVMDGLQAARVICTRWSKEKRPYLVAVTANAMEGDRDRCLAAGMDNYISKPVRIHELQTVLDAQAVLRTAQRLDSPQSILDLPDT